MMVMVDYREILRIHSLGHNITQIAGSLHSSRKENRELVDTIERYTDGLVFTMQMEEIIQTLSAAKAPKKEGKGNPYADRSTHHMPLLDAMRTASRKAFMKAFG